MRSLHPHQATPPPTMPLIVQTKCATCRLLYVDYDAYCSRYRQEEVEIKNRNITRRVILQCNGYKEAIKGEDESVTAKILLELISDKGENECDTIH